MTALLMFDSVTVSDIPDGAQAVAGYVGGLYPTWGALVAKFPHLPAISIAVNARQDAQCLDVENGDATPADVPGWLDRMLSTHPNVTPILYTSASQVAAVRRAAGGRKHLIWSAHYGHGQHLCGPGACQYPAVTATQFDDKGPNGGHFDRSVMTPGFLSAIAHRGIPLNPPAPKPTPQEPVVISTPHIDNAIAELGVAIAVRKPGPVRFTLRAARRSAIVARRLAKGA